MPRKVFRAEQLAPDTQVVLLDDLRLPVHICLGHLEAAFEEELEDLAADINFELTFRRDEH